MKFRIYYMPLIAAVLLASCGSDDSSDEPKPATYSAYQTKVYEYTPAPGQFINDGYSLSTAEDAAAYALGQLKMKSYVSLGAWGGYIVVGFDHSITNTGGYEIGIQGNAFAGSNEPGIVWVMRDDNGNGLPDDTWYQLRGSETGKEGTIENYSVTYYRPSSSGQPVRWTDNQGHEGEIAYLGAYHSQPYYYPNWITADSYTLNGTRLEARNYQVEGSQIWMNPAYDWGYADNIGSDDLTGTIPSAGTGQITGFKISNAMLPDGTPANLPSSDFVKIQTGVLAQSGQIGELSTEILSVIDLSLL